MASRINAQIEKASQQYEEGIVWRKWRMSRLTKKQRDYKQLEGGQETTAPEQAEGGELGNLVTTRLRIQYTYIELPFGWTEKVSVTLSAGTCTCTAHTAPLLQPLQRDPITNQVHYENIRAGVKRRNRPTYTYKDDLSVRRIQTAWRGFIGKRAFMKILMEENPRTLAINAIK